MPTILIVDDSAVDRKLVGGLLSKEDDIQVTFACNGSEAIDLMQRQTPDVVVTDLMMPEMDGLQLVRTLHEQFPLVPVVLMTSAGSEEIAVKALQLGASSYTPKSVLAESLLDTVKHVLNVATHNRSYSRLMQCMTERVTKFELENDYTLLPPLIGGLQDEISLTGLCDEAERVRVGVALDEALVNAMYHGNLELSSELRDHDFERYMELADARRAQEPYCHRRLHVQAVLSYNEAAFTIRDDGPGFDHRQLPDPRDPANLEHLGGRGVLLMRTFMDDIRYNEKGNEVTMIKRRSSQNVTRRIEAAS